MPVSLPGDMQPDGVQMRATRPDFFFQTNSQSVHGLHSTACFLEPLSQFTLGFGAPSSSSAECQFQQGSGIYLQLSHWIN
ncbi:hypothetical protein PBY51_003818 [Eleginops maclovinus]|uniref:Uncharacterized protein n=1 Tax=Eleginops maclovinus TaxID=56733 RepID=A0AAN7Y327_ELEMC|nr:hypothetical protein PBY51_003818 [Eleginops maclovinus]